MDLAFDGVTGLHMAREGGYDGVVLDIMLPGMSGYSVCTQLRAEENWVPLLFLSAKDGEYDLADGLDLGADDYLVKPFSYVVLAARLRALLRRGAVPRPAVLRAGDLALDPGSRSVQRGSAVVELTAREFALLEYLMRRCGEVVSKAELLSHVWDDPDEIADLNVVEVYVGYLRRKIDAPFGRTRREDRPRGRVPAGGRRWLSRRQARGRAGQADGSTRPGGSAGPGSSAGGGCGTASGRCLCAGGGGGVCGRGSRSSRPSGCWWR